MSPQKSSEKRHRSGRKANIGAHASHAPDLNDEPKAFSLAQQAQRAIAKKTSAPTNSAIIPPTIRHAAYSAEITSASDVGLLIRAARKRMKLSQQAFADSAGVGRRFVSELESGKPTLEFDKVLRVCASAGVDLFAADRTNR